MPLVDTDGTRERKTVTRQTFDADVQAYDCVYILSSDTKFKAMISVSVSCVVFRSECENVLKYKQQRSKIKQR